MSKRLPKVGDIFQKQWFENIDGSIDSLNL
jgi:hypothetical protein